MIVERIAVIDENTCPECRRLHGVRGEATESELAALQTFEGLECTNDNGCRCVFDPQPSSREGR